jgi:hypothetical protein
MQGVGIPHSTRRGASNWVVSEPAHPMVQKSRTARPVDDAAFRAFQEFVTSADYVDRDDFAEDDRIRCRIDTGCIREIAMPANCTRFDRHPAATYG